MGMFSESYNTAKASNRLPQLDRQEGTGTVTIDRVMVRQGGASGSEKFLVVEGTVESFPGFMPGDAVCLALIAFVGKYGSREGDIRAFLNAAYGRETMAADAEAAVSDVNPLAGRRVRVTATKRRGKQDPTKTYTNFSYAPVDGTAPPAAVPPPAAPAVTWYPLPAGDPRGSEYAQTATGDYLFR